ncbi:PREDICTED: reverse mRNAase [Prunus dulcis]|uniref:PREDICTED: reverse mRNAase n=1 Tax=Prunus dulcis TaxID=3755 RepID=A0A5E4FPM6_PRUDU|nr:PREDICTED: reverse mRNAase [Prunus dulcis]
MASVAPLENVSDGFYWGRILISYFYYCVKVVNYYSCIIKLMETQSNGQDYTENTNSQFYMINQLSHEACSATMWRFQDLGEVPSFSLASICMHWWLIVWVNHYFMHSFLIYTVMWRCFVICFKHFLCSYDLCFKLCFCVNMNPQLAVSSSQTRSRSTSPRSPLDTRRTPPREPSRIHKGCFTFTMENNETRVSTTALVSKVQSHYEAFCLVGKVFGVPIPGRAIRNRLKSDWKDLQEEVSVNHIGRDWYKIEFGVVEDVEFVLKHRPWFVQGQIFALQRWRPDFSPFHAAVDSIVCWARIPFLPLHYKDHKVLSDLVSILGTPICIDQASMVGKQSMFVRVCLEVDLTKPLKMCLILGDESKETRIYISYEALFVICFYCS